MTCTATFLALLLFGDSRCFTGFPDAPTTANLLAKKCPGVEVRQDCRIGRGTRQPGHASKEDPLAQLEAALATHPFDACLLDLGVNDWHVPDTTPRSVASRLIDMGRRCEARGARPIFATGWPVADAGQPGRAAWSAEVRRLTIAAGRAMGWSVIDTWEAFDARTWVASCTQGDGIHPHALPCRETWAAFVARRLP